MFFTRDEDFRKLDPFDGIHIMACSGERMTISVLTFEAGGVVPMHAHPHEQMGVVLEGSFILALDGEEKELHAGDAYVVPPNAPHSARAERPAKTVDVFSPRRDEYA